jgi:predicted O-methyltransferase YrrM
MKFLINFLAPVLPPKAISYLEHASKHKKFFFPFGGPMNGQTARLEIVRELLEYCQVRRIIETGTYRGTTTEWFASFNIPVTSIETMARFAEFARFRLRGSPHVDVRIGNSVDHLAKIVAEGKGMADCTLFYLDAHWYDYLPLRDEYDLIFGNYSSPIIVVDDFQVPGDPGYGYDDYGQGMSLTLDYLLKGRKELPFVFFPVTKSQWESGLKRGCVVITQNEQLAAEISARIPLLRRWTLEHPNT